ncbi:MAG: hypothetical protein EOM76_08170 [Sphingobacteriia bacterium]|nr:hypothetical protein [Sphingobacteriia bacterium]
MARILLLEFMDLTAPNKTYKITNKFVTYEFLSRTSMQFKNEFYVKPLHDGVDNIVDKYKWSVNQELHILPITQGHDVQKMDMDSVFGYQQYRIFFNRSYNKEDKPIRTGIVIEDMHDVEKKSLLHLGTGIYDITSTLTLKIIFNSSLQPINIRELEYIHYTDEQHYYCKRIHQAELNEQTGNKEINWVIKHPIYGGKYMIEWDFFEG